MNKLIHGNCLDVLKNIPSDKVNLTLTDIPYGEVNRSDNGLRKLDKANADVETFDLQEFLKEVYRVTNGTIIIFCGKEQLSEIHKFFSDEQKKNKGTVRQLYRHVKTIDNCQIINPKEGFYQWRKRFNFVPTRFARACCSIFKEGAMVDELDHETRYIFFLGMRNEESPRRSSYGDAWRNDKWSENWDGCLPIREWTELDVWLYILMNNIDFNPKYKKGYARCGCAVACPYYSKSTWVLDKYWYRKLYDRWQNILREDFISNKKWLIMNCTLKEYTNKAWSGGTYRDEPTEEVIKEFMEYSGLEDFNLAKQHFNKSCCECDKRIKDKNVLAMNMKIHGRQINKFYCKKCFMKLYNLTEDNWNDRLQSFKQSGCALF